MYVLIHERLRDYFLTKDQDKSELHAVTGRGYFKLNN